jgi:hypothetical protein
MPEYNLGIHGSGWAIVVVTFIIGVFSIAKSLIIHFLPGTAEKGARKRHESTVLLAGRAALQHGDPMDLMIDDEFWKLAKKHETERRALGSTC